MYGQLALQGTQQGRADLPRQWEPTRRACLLVVTNGGGSLVLQVYYNKQLKQVTSINICISINGTDPRTVAAGRSKTGLLASS